MRDGDQRPLRLGAVILAAGGSSRLGRAKQLLEIGGRPLVARAVDAALDAGARPVVAVLGANSGSVREALAGRDILVVDNPGWAAGMASSIRLGLAALLRLDPALDAVLVTPCDQPAFGPDTILALANLHQATRNIACASYGGRKGAPAIFGSIHFAALERLQGDRGARNLLNAAGDTVSSLDMPELGIDIDTPGDLAAWLSRRGGESSP